MTIMNENRQFDPIPTLIIVLLMLVWLMVSNSCTTTKYVPYPEHHTEYVVRTDTVQTLDSIYINDKTYVYTAGDTVFVRQILYKDRWRDRYTTKTDTLLRRDSVVQVKEVEVERPDTLLEKTVFGIGVYTIIALALLAIWCGIKLLRK